MTMSKLIFLIFLFFVTANAQWIAQQVPTTNALYDVYFADSTEGWVTGRDGIFHTSDGGNTWERKYQGYSSYLSGLSDTEVWATSLRDTLLHTTNGGIVWDIITINGFTDFDSTWSLSTVYFYDTNIGWTQAQGWISGAIRIRLLRTTDGGLTWEMRTHPWLSSNALIQFFDTTYGYRTGSNIPFFRTTDGGETWDLVSWYGYMGTFSMQFLTKNIGWMSTDGPVLTTSVIKTTDGGDHWFDNITFQCSDLSTYLSFVDTLTGWIVQWTCLSGGTEIWHTFDGGTTWNLQFIYSPPFYFSPRKIYFVDLKNGWVIGDNGIVLHTSTGGVIPVELTSFSAEVIDNGVMLNWITVTEVNNQGFELQRQVGSMKSAVGDWVRIGFVPGFGTTTEPRSYSFTDENVTTEIYKYRLKQIDYDGTFSYSNVVEVEFSQVPEEFILYQNYPNPFNPLTIIKFNVPSAVFVNISIYNSIGEKVATVINEQLNAGVHRTSFDAGNLSSGLYFYRLTSGNLIITKKMLLIK